MEAALRHLGDKLRFVQVLLALFAALVAAAPDMRGLHALPALAAGFSETPERQTIDQIASPLLRGGEEIDEFFGDEPPDARLRVVRFAQLQGPRLPEWIHASSVARRTGAAHPARAPPTV